VAVFLTFEGKAPHAVESLKSGIEVLLMLGCCLPRKASTLRPCRDCSQCFLTELRVSRYCFWGSP